MTPHLLVLQLRFARSEFVRSLEGLSEEDAVRRLPPLNCISWMVGHLANHEHFYWVRVAQQKEVVPGLNELAGYGSPATTPPLRDMWAAWKKVTLAADEYLDTLTTASMTGHLTWKGESSPENIGTLLMRNIYHCWFHTGEASAVRQMLGHTNLPEFVGNMSMTVYTPEN
jgi:hypothetical protein